MKENDSFILQI